MTQQQYAALAAATSGEPSSARVKDAGERRAPSAARALPMVCECCIKEEDQGCHVIISCSTARMVELLERASKRSHDEERPSYDGAASQPHAHKLKSGVAPLSANAASTAACKPMQRVKIAGLPRSAATPHSSRATLPGDEACTNLPAAHATATIERARSTDDSTCVPPAVAWPTCKTQRGTSQTTSATLTAATLGAAHGGELRLPSARASACASKPLRHVRYDRRIHVHPWSGRVTVHGRRIYTGAYGTMAEAARRVDLILLSVGREPINYAWRPALAHERTRDARGEWCDWVCLDDGEHAARAAPMVSKCEAAGGRARQVALAKFGSGSGESESVARKASRRRADDDGNGAGCGKHARRAPDAVERRCFRMGGEASADDARNETALLIRDFAAALGDDAPALAVGAELHGGIDEACSTVGAPCAPPAMVDDARNILLCWETEC
ncbi:hypothetical protein KFE25_002203 [Diacronema lutheri]|uniref:AP2/ERF domain-containing protein n=1 Tax=Diacronema lutheri TaxID=2081491 RepID=A0A8J6C9F2_DIALT|nr:hypothetical protein KFE25_002203 [Diacronema lutheri]